MGRAGQDGWGITLQHLQPETNAIRGLLRLVLLISALASTGLAGTFVAYGPQRFARDNGKPTAVTANFSVVDTATTYTLRIDNTGVSSAVVTLNGVDVAGPSDFNANATVITKPVTLSLNNQLSVELRGKPGESFSLQIIGVDNLPPTIIGVAVPPANAAGWNNSNVTVTFTCSDKTSGVASCSAPVTVATEAASQVVTGTALDKAGNTASTSVKVNLDKTTPQIAPTVVPAPNAAGWNNSNVTVSFACSDGLSGIDVCPPSVSVTAEGASQLVSGTAKDKAGNTASSSATVKLDKTPPAITISAPATGTTVSVSSQTISGTLAEALSGIASVTCSGVPANVTGTNFSCGITLVAGTNSIAVRATDVAGNAATATVTLVFAAPITLTFTSPANLSYLNLSPTTVNGTVSDPAASVTINSIAASVANGRFSATIPLAEGPNTITASAKSASGAVGTAGIQVTLDTTPPSVSAKVTPAPNAAGWNNTNVTVSFACADALSAC